MNASANIPGIFKKIPSAEQSEVASSYLNELRGLRSVYLTRKNSTLLPFKSLHSLVDVPNFKRPFLQQLNKHIAYRIGAG